MSILESIGFKKKFHVGISVSATNFIELVAVDKKTKTVIAYASGNVKYNNAIREIIDYDEFAEVVETLFNDAGLLPSDCSVSLSIPNVQFGITSIESAAEKNFIIDNIQSEIEDLYVFKRSGNEPFISFTELNNSAHTIVFGAVQTKVVRRLMEIFDTLGCDISRIESSYTSFFKSLQFCERFSKYMKKEERASVLLVTANSCCSFYFEDGLLLDYFEEPLAVKSFSKDEVYSTISKIVETTIDKNRPMSLLIVSETDEVDPAVLTSAANFQGEVDTINKGINNNEKFIDISMDAGLESSMIAYMTIESVGAAVANFDEYPIDINFLPSERIKKDVLNVGEYEVSSTNYVAVTVLAGLLLAGLVIGSVVGIFGLQKASLEKQTSASNDKINVFKQKAADAKNKFKGLYPSLKHIVDTNAQTNDIFNALSTDIPENIYIRQFATNSDGGIIIVGKAKSSDAVREFVTSLKAKNNDLHLSKFAVDENQVNLSARANNYVFEIKTQSVDIVLNDGNSANAGSDKKTVKNKPLI